MFHRWNFFAPVCSLCVKVQFHRTLYFVFFNFLCFTLFFLLFAIIFITFAFGFDKLISLVEK